MADAKVIRTRDCAFRKRQVIDRIEQICFATTFLAIAMFFLRHAEVGAQNYKFDHIKQSTG